MLRPSLQSSIYLSASLLALGGIFGQIGINTSVLAQSTLRNDPTPLYPPTAPPPNVDPRRIQRRPLETDYRVSALQRDVNGNLWVGTWRGLARLDPNTGSVLARISLANFTIGAIAQDKVGRIWVGTYEGLQRVEIRTNETTA
ncbi:MAG TPA: transcriptional regulator, partial [Cyanobacteria bacterium UBA8543]|nr:transcriptional regulator [Cyanobacteria bacterium UBA8543]